MELKEKEVMEKLEFGLIHEHHLQEKFVLWELEVVAG